MKVQIFTSGNNLNSTYAFAAECVSAFFRLYNSGRLREGRIDYYDRGKTSCDLDIFAGTHKRSASDPELWRFPGQCVHALLDEYSSAVVTLSYE